MHTKPVILKTPNFKEPNLSDLLKPNKRTMWDTPVKELAPLEPTAEVPTAAPDSPRLPAEEELTAEEASLLRETLRRHRGQRAMDDGVHAIEEPNLEQERATSLPETPVRSEPATEALEGGYTGPPEKMVLIRQILLKAGGKYDGHAIRIQPRDSSTQDIYTLSIRPKDLTSAEPRANDWVGVQGGTLAAIYESLSK